MMGGFKVKLVAYFVLLALVPIAAAFWGFSTIAARSETRQADARLQASLRAAVAAYDDRLAAAQAQANAYARRPAVANELALRHVVHLGRRTRRHTTRTALVYRGSRLLGRVVVSVPLDARFAQTLARRIGLTDGDRVAFVSAGAPREPQTIGRYRVVAAPPVEVLTPQARITAASARTERRFLAALLLTLLLVAVAAWLEGRSIVRTVRRLVRAANAIAAGDLKRRVPAHGRDELATLGRSFNAMAEQLEERMRELEAERGRLQDAITLFGAALAATHDMEQLLRVVLDAELEATGATGGLVIVDGGIAAQAGVFGGDDRIEVPLRAGRENFGRLVLSGKRFTDDDRMTAASLAAHAVVALDNARLHRIVEHQALVDGLTGLANRRQGERALETELARAERFGGPVAFVLCDLDNFKVVNDQYGHAVGDDVLRELGSVLEETVRTVDVAARWGGEEFALVLPGTDADGAALLAERARDALARRTILTPDGAAVAVTASFGVAAYPGHGAGDALVAVADAALYRAKRAGKNRVETAPVPPAVRAGS